MVSSEVSILIVIQYCSFAPVSGLFGDLFESASSEFGLDPVDYFRLKKQESRKRKRRKNHHHPDLRGSFSKRKSSSGPRTEFLVPERYEPPPPDCNGGDGTLSGMTFINFLLSAIAVAANVVSNINSNQRNNNNNNNNNNDNVANYNFANNNNAANNLNTIQICPFPCIPGPPPIPTGKRRRRSEMIHGNGLKVASEVAQNVKRWSSGNLASTEIEDHGSDIYLASMLALKLYWNLNRSSDPNKAFCHLYQDLEKHEGLDRPATSLLTIVASRLAYHFQENLRSNAVSSCQHVPVGNQSSTTILT